MSDAEFEKYRAQFGDNLLAILWDFAAVLMTMSVLKSIAVCSYWLEEINSVHVISVVMYANAIIFLSCPRWTSMYATMPVLSYLLHIIFDMLFCTYINPTSPSFSVERVASKIVVMAALILMAVAAYSQQIYVCVAELKEKRNQSELKKKE